MKIEKRRFLNTLSYLFIIFGGIFAVRLLVSSVSATANDRTLIHMHIWANESVSDKQEAIIVYDENSFSLDKGKCIYGNVDNFLYGYDKGNENGKTNIEWHEIKCNASVDGITYDSSTRKLVLDNYTGNDVIGVFDMMDDGIEDFNVEVIGVNAVKALAFGSYYGKNNNNSLTISGNGVLNLGDGGILPWDSFEKVNVNNITLKNNASEERETASVSTFAEVVNVNNIEAEDIIFSGSSVYIKNSKINSAHLVSTIALDMLKIDGSDITGSIIANHVTFTSRINNFEVSNSNINIDGQIFYMEDAVNGATIKNSNFRIRSSRDDYPSFFVGSKFTDCEEVGCGSVDGDKVTDLISISDATIKDDLFVKSIVNCRESFDHIFDKKVKKGCRRESAIVDSNTKLVEEKNPAIDYHDGQEYKLARLMSWKNFPTEISIVANNPDIVGYRGRKILEGADPVMNVENIQNVTIRYDFDISLFKELKIDDKIVPENYYTLKSGSTIVEINAEYFESLNAGKYTIAAYFKGEEEPVKTTLSIMKKAAVEDIPETGGGSDEDDKKDKPAVPIPTSTGGSDENGKKDESAIPVPTSTNTGLFTIEDINGDTSNDSIMVYVITSVSLVAFGIVMRFCRISKKRDIKINF